MIEYPRLVAVETTNRCNAKCVFCPNNSLARERRVMSNELFKKIIDDCTKFELPAIEPFLQGEPFVDPHIFDRLAYINEKLPNTALRLYSNGAALTPRKADALRRLNISTLYISLNTINSERYEKIVGLPFEKTMENIRWLATPTEKGKVAPEIVFRITLVDDIDKKEILGFRKMCKELGVKPMTVGLFNYKGDIHSELPVPPYPCEHINRLDILSSGETTLCCMDQEGEYGFGSVENDSVLDVFNNRKARQVRDMHRYGKRLKFEPCNKCNLFWPSLAHLPLKWKLKHSLDLAMYFVKHRPLSARTSISLY